MNHGNTPTRTLLAAATLASWLLAPQAASAQDFKSFFTAGQLNKPPAPVHVPCQGKVRQVGDIAFEGVKTTTANWANPANGGGEIGRFDKLPVLSTKVVLKPGCLNAHLSAMVGSAQSYGGVSAMTLFQVTLTPPGGTPQHMVGHYETPYGIYGPAVALSAEYDVDMLGSNFYQSVGTGTGQIPPGAYRVDVWWAGGPATPGGAIGADFVLKLYH